MRDILLGAIIGLARATENNEELTTSHTAKLLAEGLRAASPTFRLEKDYYHSLFERIMAEKWRIIPSCHTCQTRCGRTDNYMMKELWNEDEEIRSLKLVILTGVQTLAEYMNVVGYENEELNRFLYKALIMIGIYWDAEGLMPTLKELGDMQYKVQMQLFHNL